MKKCYYAKHNCYGVVGLSYDSIGWQVYRFTSKADRDNYVDAHKWDGCNQINAKIRAKNVSKILGTGWHKKSAIVDSFRDGLTGIDVDIIDLGW